jgi:cytidylate kinase
MNQAELRVVTIDGPAGAGKSSVARSLAARLGWRLLDTGAMYRAVTFAALRDHADLTCDDELGTLAERVSVRLANGSVYLDDEDVTGRIRSVEVTRASRYLADNPRVRARLVRWQRDFADDHEVVAEGRDQGTVVFPHAFCKFFLTASLEARGMRRFAEFQARGEAIDFETVLGDLERRDRHDEARAIAPMRPADDAIVVDSTGLSLDEVVDRIEAVVRRRLESIKRPQTAVGR